MTTIQEIESMKIALQKLEATNTAAADALRACDETKAKAEAAYAAAQTPQSKRALRDAREDEEDAHVVAGAAVKRVEAARAELAAMELDHARTEYARAFEGVTPDAFKRNIEPEIAALLRLRCEENTIATTLVAKIKAHDAALEKVRTLAGRAGICPPGRSGVDLGTIREEVIRRRRIEVPVLANVPDVHEWVSTSAQVYAT